MKPKLQDLKLLSIVPDSYIELLQPLYSICDSGDNWAAILNRYIKEKLQMKPMSGDPALNISIDDSNTNVILGACLDNSMFAVGPGFESAVDHIRHEFDSKSLDWDNKDFVELRVKTKNCGDVSRSWEIHQREYLRISYRCRLMCLSSVSDQ